MDRYIELTRNWIAQWVIGLNLCPFASVPFRKDQIRYTLSMTTDPEKLMGTFLEELNHLLGTPTRELTTTLLIHPKALNDFESYLEFVVEAEDILEQAGLAGVFQIATFHPDYCFDDAPPFDPANYTNRSPYPMLHILREESISEAVEHYPDTGEIPERNVSLLRELGLEKVRQMQEEIGYSVEE